MRHADWRRRERERKGKKTNMKTKIIQTTKVIANVMHIIYMKIKERKKDI